MNYLAHAYLSFNHPQVLAGNMISDYVKGKTQYDYPIEVQAGIRLHRAIDDFTDQHPVTKELIQIFKPQYRLYAGAFVDIVYDYFLANDINEFENDGMLLDFTIQTYQNLQPFLPLFPTKFKTMFPYMVSQNWLYNYQFDHGIQKSFNGLVYRAAYLDESNIAFELFIKNKDLIKQQYQLFFSSVKKFATHTMQDLLKQ